MWCLALVMPSFHQEPRQPWHTETRTQNTWVLYSILQLLNQPWKHFASRLLMLANRSSLCKPLILDILLLYLKLKMTFTICEITNRMGPISLLEKFWKNIYIYLLLSKERRNQSIYWNQFLFFSCIALNWKGGHLVRARSNAPTISLPS